jgi:hypothetical protein
MGHNISQGDVASGQERAAQGRAGAERVAAQAERVGGALIHDHGAVQELEQSRLSPQAIGNPAHKRETLGDKVCAVCAVRPCGLPRLPPGPRPPGTRSNGLTQQCRVCAAVLQIIGPLVSDTSDPTHAKELAA